VEAGRLGLAGWDYEAVRLDVFTETARAFIAVLAAQERLALADSLLNQAQRFYTSVAARVQAGKVSALEERRAQVVRATTQIAREQAAREQAIEQARLAATWGSTAPAFEQVAGDLTAVAAVPPNEQHDAFIERNPDVARWRDEMALRRSEIALERARRIPDPVLTLGTRRLRDLGETALAAGVSLPLPLFDRNQGAIREAQYRYRQGEAAQQAVRVQAHQQLRVVYERLVTAQAEVTTLREDVLPAAQEHFAATEEGYREGKFDLLTVLDAQRTLFEATHQYVDAAQTYHQSRAEVERLIGTPLDDLN
jgi:cobalt-zinc-cadmium efflux system outer membrane protein